jgi:hypothetical protein
MLDQEWRLMRFMAILSNVYSTVERMRSLQGAEIHSLSGSERRLLQWLKDEGMVLNG